VEAKSLISDSIPGIIVMDEKQRRMRDYFMRMDLGEAGKQMSHFGKKTFNSNTSNSNHFKIIRI